MSKQKIFHVRLGKRRTTISVDKIISTLLALHLDVEPGTDQAHSVVRSYFQKKLDEHSDPGRDYVTSWLREQALLDLLDKNLSKAYWTWFDKTWDLSADRKIGRAKVKTKRKR